VKEGEFLQIGDEQLQILHTPGHSPGSISLYYQKGGWVITGDVLFRESIGRTDLPGSDFATLEQSIRAKLYSLPDNTHVYTGHGMPTTIGYEKANNPFVPAG
jgi:glyoxylase-like metal-dependent hydrolase (beta-lactamase superfamily II)